MSTIETLRPAPSSAVAVAPPAHLPTFDISGLYGDARQRAAMADMLRDILHTHGFFYLTGHGADPALLTRTMEMAKRFFALPLEDKQAIDIVHSPQFRGYTRAGGELTRGKPDWREQVDFDREEDLLPVDADLVPGRESTGVAQRVRQPIACLAEPQRGEILGLPTPFGHRTSFESNRSGRVHAWTVIHLPRAAIAPSCVARRSGPLTPTV